MRTKKAPGIRLRRWLAVVAALVSGAASAAAQVEIGMNYNWWRFAPKSPIECETRPASVWQGNWILDQYQLPAVRRIVQGQLRSMRAAGFSRLRVMVTHSRPAKNHLSGALQSATGELSPRDAANVRAFVGDIAGAGYRGLEITYGFLEANALYCKRHNWGDCFEPSRTEENWRFISEVAQITSSAAGGMPLRFDLNNEACPAPSMPPATIANASRYLTTIARRFQARFGQNWLISCADSPNAQRAALMVRELSQGGLSPRFIEVHTYRTDPRFVSGVLDGANGLAQRLDGTLILGEMRYHSAEEMGIVRHWLQAHPQSRLREIYEWPLHDPTTGCRMDAAPPYTP